jgi:peptidoglycan-N-acetylglucosamine deacetylase
MFKKLALLFFLAFLATFAYRNSLLFFSSTNGADKPARPEVQHPLVTSMPPGEQRDDYPSRRPKETPKSAEPSPLPTASPKPTPKPTPKPIPRPTLKPSPKPYVPGTKTAYLTIDDGPSKNTMKILEVLSNHNVKATFFVNGKEGSYYENLYREIVKGGHTLGNHTYSHDYSYIYSSVDNFMKDYAKLDSYLYRITGVKPEIMRFPGGSNNQSSWQYSGKTFMKEKLIPAVLNKGYIYFDWNVSTGDTAASTVPTQTIINNVKNQLGNKNYAIILMHDLNSKTTTPEALPEIIRYLKEKGYELKTLDMNSPPHRFQ